MKKLLNISLMYAIAGLVGGVFYREFTKYNGYTDVTTLGKIHGHLLLLGMIMFLVVALFYDRYPLANNKKFKSFMNLYNIGLPMSVILMVVRGVTEVLGMNLSKGTDAAISGISGLGHIFLGAGIIFLLLSLKEVVPESQNNE